MVHVIVSVDGIIFGVFANLDKAWAECKEINDNTYQLYSHVETHVIE